MPHPATIYPYHPVGHPFIELESVDSTNNYAMAQVHAGLAFPGSVFFAHEQFAGKGQRAKTWASAPALNIAISVVLQPHFLTIRNQFALSACVAVAAYDFLRLYTTTDIHIKWPNDLYWRDRKAGGILIENILHGSQWQYAIAGIGLNINQETFPEHLPNPVSLKQVTSKTYNPVELAKQLCNCIEKRYHSLQEFGFRDLLKDYNKALYKAGETVTLIKDNVLFETEIRRVNSKGQLQTFDTIERIFNHGDISWEIA